jgi:hypothetical protein
LPFSCIDFFSLSYRSFFDDSFSPDIYILPHDIIVVRLIIPISAFY